MKASKRVIGALTHPVTLVPLAVALGLLIHHWTSPKPSENPPSLVARELAEAEPMSRSAAASTAPVEETEPPVILLPAPPSPAELPPLEPHGVPSGAPELASSGATVEAVTQPLPTLVEEIQGKELPDLQTLAPLNFREIWAYLMMGEENRWSQTSVVSDVFLFSLRLDETGHLSGKVRESSLVAARSRLGGGRRVRVHLVVASSGQKGLLHFVLDPRYGRRSDLVSRLAALVREHSLDGLQIDFESLRLEDRGHFIEWLGQLRAALPKGTIFSIALPARDRMREKDAFDYRHLANVADRFLIMVYDQHWKGGPPGSISGNEWHGRVVQYALSHFPSEKLVVGLPFYGRIWQLDRGARATRHTDLETLSQAPGFELKLDPEKGHRMQFRREVRFEGWFEDAASTHTKMSSAQQLGALNVGFWRLGQEDERVWQLLTLEQQ